MEKMMIFRKIILAVLVLCGNQINLIASSLPISSDSPIVITYELGSRFGDNLLCYLHAKWLSYHYKLPLLYVPFPHSDQLALHTKEKRLDTGIVPFLNKIKFVSGTDINSLPHNTLLTVPYFVECPEYTILRPHFKKCYFKVEWKNRTFRKLINEMVAPSPALPLVYPPKGKLSIAIHVRDGGSFDNTAMKKDNFLKFPSYQFYLEALEVILNKNLKKPIYIYLFTDAIHPQKIKDRFQAYFKDYNHIEFGCTPAQAGDKQLLIDFFSMLNFDCLIRGESNFSTVVSKLKDFKILITPKYQMGDNKNFTISGLKIEKNS
jgi:hypothetical protein